MFTVYAAKGSQDPVYIGYVEGGLDKAKEWLEFSSARTTASEVTRFDVRFRALYNGDMSSVKYTKIAECETREEARTVRDENRATNPNSFGDPSPLPPDTYKAASDKYPERIRKYNEIFKARRAATARDAMGVLFSSAQIKNHPAPREEKVADLDRMKPDPFMVKYGFPMPTIDLTQN